MKTIQKLGVASALLGFSIPLLAEVEANIGVTSNYLWRGVTQSGSDASVSGGLDYSNDSGFYAGTWVGSLDDGDEPVGGGSAFDGSETDLYFGFAGDISEGVGYDVGYIYYHYSTQEDADFSEIYASVSASVVTVGAAYTVDSQVDDAAGSGEQYIEGDVYIYGSVGFDLSDEFSLGATIGNYAFDDDGEGGAELDYTHYQVDLTKSTESMGDFTFTISSSDVDGADTDVVVSWGIAL